MGSGDIRLKQLESHLARLEDRLDRIETLLLSQEAQMDEVRALFQFFRGSIRFYDEVSHLLSYVSSFRKASQHKWIYRDSLARDIVFLLARKGPMNVSQLARDIREDKGKASRRIIAARVQKLVESGVVRQRWVSGSRRLELAGSSDDAPSSGGSGPVPYREAGQDI